MDQTRESQVVQAMIRLADTLVAGYDVVELLQTLADETTDLVGSDAAGILLADPNGRLEVIAASDENPEFAELLQRAAVEGPCADCFATGYAISSPDLTHETRWPRFRQDAAAQGYGSANAFPLRLRQTTIGSLTLFATQIGDIEEQYAQTAQALADMATIGILHGRALEEASRLSNQLQHALDSRVIIEQAKGFVAYRNGISLADAFDLLRTRARSQRTPLSELARQIIAREIEP